MAHGSSFARRPHEWLVSFDQARQQPAGIYLDGRDRQHFLELLPEMISRYSLEVHAYVLRSNHYHPLAETPEANLVAGRQNEFC